ncbi:MAG: FliI/YscN family ATPase [Acidobacteria bacterium]|nr:FliI/YscN family ATPase [Acidobacteriota bacterium]
MTDLMAYGRLLDRAETRGRRGVVTGVTGLVVESKGPRLAIGEEVDILSPEGEVVGLAEIVGFRGNRIFTMPLTQTRGIAPGFDVVSRPLPAGIRVDASMVGQVLDGLGRPLRGAPRRAEGTPYPLHPRPSSALDRGAITDPLPTGVRTIDALLTCGKGQRVGIFAGSGVGKSTLLGMIARHTAADVNVIALVGERGREVGDFIDGPLGPEGMARSVVFVSTSDEPPMMRVRAALAAAAAAEYFRDQGKDVLFMMDSVTRVAMALREVALSAGEPPASKGYPPSVFAFMPGLFERAGRWRSGGSVTGFYTVLVEGDDLADPVADTARALLDGHIVLSRALTSRGHFPSIDVLESVSRLMPHVASPDHLAAALLVRRAMAVHRDSEDLINIGAYKEGVNRDLDVAVRAMGGVRAFLQQGARDRADFPSSVESLMSISRSCS